MKKILQIIGLVICGTLMFFVSISQAGTPKADCKNINSLNIETQSRLLGKLSKTNDSQIYRDQCGNNVAIMHSQLLLPQISLASIANEYKSSARDLGYNGVPVLHSNPSATRKLFLDMDGYTFPTDLRDSAWLMGASYGGLFKGLALPGGKVPGLDLDGNPSSFSSVEVAYATETWQAVAEAFSILDIDVTTEDPSLSSLSRSSINDINFGMTAVVSSSATWSQACNCGGLAYQPSFNQLALSPNGLNIMNPAFNFNKFDPKSNSYISAKDLGGIINHELGHTLGLTHDGTSPSANVKTSNLEYYPGHGNWAPIMGSSWGKAIRQWSKNEYRDGVPRSPGNGCGEPTGGWWPKPSIRDDFSIFACNDVFFRSDDYGNSIEDARTLSTGESIAKPLRTSEKVLRLSGIIGPNDDKDFFKLILPKNIAVSISATPIANSPMLDVLLKIYDSNGVPFLSVNPEMSKGSDGKPLGLDALMPRRDFTAGTFYVSVEGTGSGSPLDTGYSTYSSVGQYSINVVRYYKTQSPLLISNTGRMNVAGTSVVLTTSGGSGTGAIKYGHTGANCILSNGTLTATAAAKCVVRAFKESDEEFFEAVSVSATFIFSPAAQSASTISKEKKPALQEMGSR